MEKAVKHVPSACINFIQSCSHIEALRCGLLSRPVNESSLVILIPAAQRPEIATRCVAAQRPREAESFVLSMLPTLSF